MWISKKTYLERLKQAKVEGAGVEFDRGFEKGKTVGVDLGRHLQKMKQDRMGFITGGNFELDDILNGRI